ARVADAPWIAAADSPGPSLDGASHAWSVPMIAGAAGSPGAAPAMAIAPPLPSRGEPAPTAAIPPAAAPARGGWSPLSASDAVDGLHTWRSEVRIPFAPGGDIAEIPPPGAATPVEMPAFDIPAFAIERLPLLDDTIALTGEPVRPGGEGSHGAPGLPIAVPGVARVEAIDALYGSPAGSEPRVDGAMRSTGGTAFDPHAVRRDFPILGERVHGGKRLVWLDNAATTQKPRAVIDRLSSFYEHENSNVHRAAHVLAARATDAYEGARETTRKFLNASSASEIVFVRGATEGINLIAKAWGRRHVERGDEIVLTHLEHHANIVPWQQLCAEVGARLRVAPVDERGDVILEEYEKLLCSRTRLVAFTQVSNALGTVTPAREMIEIAHRRGATVVLDGAQAVSHMPVDVQALDCDFYVFSGHKVFAPTGIGAVFGKRALLDAMPPWQGGGNMIADVTFERTQYQQPPWRFEAGTGNIADAAGLGAALDYVLRIGMPTIERYEHELLAYATERLATVPGLRMIGTPRNKAGVLSFVLAGQRTEDVGAALDKDGIAVRSGHHCAQPILRRYGLESTVRASLAFYNVDEDIDALVASLRRLQATSA
ncbi:MAG TPA: family 2A encapsulin nanocompartment cargo protein cysteine desulfurase, partial [Kofleriaceae bacterium]